MAYNNSLNAACDLNEYLYCKMPTGALDVQLKVKTTWGKFTMVQEPTPKQKSITHGRRAREILLGPEKGKHPAR